MTKVNVFDGSDEPLTFGQALCEIVQRVSWQTEEHQRQALRAVQEEFDLVPPDPDPVAVYNDPRDITLANQDAELEQLRRQLEKANLEKELAVVEAENRVRRENTHVVPDKEADDVAPGDDVVVSSEAGRAGKKH